MLPAMKSQNRKHLQGQGMGTARDTEHEPPRHGDGATEQHTAKQMGYSKCWFSTAMTQPLHGQNGENSDSPSSEGLHGQTMVGNEEPRWLLTPCQETPESQRPQAGQRDQCCDQTTRDGGDVKAPRSNTPSVRKHTEVTKGQTS